MRFHGSHLREISQRMTKLSFCIIGSEITILQPLPCLQGANDWKTVRQDIASSDHHRDDIPYCEYLKNLLVKHPTVST